MCIIRYEKRILIEFKLDWMPCVGQFNVGFLPHTVQKLQLSVCTQQWHLQTRLLLRNARTVDFNESLISGCVDLQNLHAHLLSLNVHRNVLCGELSLMGLTNSLQAIDLSDNRSLCQSLLYFSELPETILRIDLKGTKVQEVQRASIEYTKSGMFAMDRYWWL